MNSSSGALSHALVIHPFRVAQVFDEMHGDQSKHRIGIVGNSSPEPTP
jgi:hypothetical protein